MMTKSRAPVLGVSSWIGSFWIRTTKLLIFKNPWTFCTMNTVCQCIQERVCGPTRTAEEHEAWTFRVLSPHEHEAWDSVTSVQDSEWRRHRDAMSWQGQLMVTCLDLFIISSVQWLSHVWLFATPWTAARQASLSITNSRSLPRLMSIKSVMPSSHLILCRPLLLLPSIFPSIWIFSNESVLHIRWPKYWSFNFSISPSKEYSEMMRTCCTAQGTLLSTPWWSKWEGNPSGYTFMYSWFTLLYSRNLTKDCKSTVLQYKIIF